MIMPQLRYPLSIVDNEDINVLQVNIHELF